MSTTQQTLYDLNQGRTMAELTAALREACAAVQAHGKPATVQLAINISTMKEIARGLEDMPLAIRAEITTKLPKHEPPITVFFIGEDGMPTRQAPTRQTSLPGLVDTQTGAISK